jgi:hypothetical protein
VIDLDRWYFKGQPMRDWVPTITFEKKTYEPDPRPVKKPKKGKK